MLLVAKEPKRFTTAKILFLICWYWVCCPSNFMFFHY